MHLSHASHNTQQNPNKLQLIQNAAARLITRSSRRERIILVLKSLQRLPVRFRVDFKILMITFKARRGMAAEYIVDLLTLWVWTQPERSFLAISWSNIKTKGDRVFSVQAPQMWNDLPGEIRDMLSSFKSFVKTHHFRLTFTWFYCLFVISLYVLF